MLENNNLYSFKKRYIHSRFFLTVFFYFCIYFLQAQEYRALNGSIYAGNLATGNNPASIVNLPSPIDFTPFSFQLKYATNSLNVTGSSYLPKWEDANAVIANGTFERYVMTNADINLLNTRIRLNCNSAISFGITGRVYQSLKTSEQNWQEDMKTARDFMGLNINNTPLSAIGTGNGWVEYHGTYARSIKVYDNAVLNAGITFKYITGIAGAYLSATELDEAAGLVNNENGYYLTNGLLDYGYSSNWDTLNSAYAFNDGFKNFLKDSRSTVGVSLGAEYVVSRNGEVENGFPLRIGVALLDLGHANYNYSKFSRTAVLDKPNVSDSLLDQKFGSIYDTESFADSLETIAGSYATPTGKFKLIQPTRLVISIDKHLSGNFFVNSDLTIPLADLFGKKQFFVREMNLLNLSFRYEKSNFGLYLPVSLNSQFNFWVGGAVRAGPFVLGFHNLANLISKNKIENGGGYLAFNFRINTRKQFNCDVDEMGVPRNPRTMKQLKCPPSVN